VILDGLNYIKGWRYQLHTEAKNLRTPSAVLQIGCAVNKARVVNEARLKARAVGTSGDKRSTNQDVIDDGAEEAYESGNWENLVFRYEEPNAMNRWDSPLFTLIWEDDDAQTKRVFDDLWEAIAGEGRKVIKPNQAAAQKSSAPAGDFLYVLDRETQDIVKRILEAQGEQGGGKISISGTSNEGGASSVVQLPAGRQVGLPQLQRLRRAYVALNRGGLGLEAAGSLNVKRIREGFVGYLNDSFENE
jgi:protein KTI12